jgi:hypothetical protein
MSNEYKLIKRINELPNELTREIYSYLDFTYNTYVITSGKKNNKLILIQKPICEVITIQADEIFFITKNSS